MTLVSRLSIGAEAPDFDLPSSLLGENGKPGKKIRLRDFRGQKNVVLAFFPLAFSPVCSQEHRDLMHQLGEFQSLNAQILGISVDSSWALAAFAKTFNIDYPMLSDFHPKGAVARAYDLFLEELGITARATVIVGKDGRIKYVKIEQIPDPRSNALILQALRDLSS
jgi:peroxiredoxin (alkyl hydroperoxide reductase subunit C)